jgi:hypothetical protein
MWVTGGERAEDPSGPGAVESNRDATRRQLPFVKQLGLIFTSRKIFDSVDVTAYSFFRVVKALQFLQHQFTKMGHKNVWQP